jgi:hypothetical protein
VNNSKDKEEIFKAQRSKYENSFPADTTKIKAKIENQKNHKLIPAKYDGFLGERKRNLKERSKNKELPFGEVIARESSIQTELLVTQPSSAP